MKRAFEPVVEPVAPPTTLLEALLAAPQLRQIPADVFKYLVVPFAQCPFESVLNAWEEVGGHSAQHVMRAPLPAAPALALLPNGAVRPEVQAYFDGLAVEVQAYFDGLAVEMFPYYYSYYSYYEWDPTVERESHAEAHARMRLWSLLERRRDWKHMLLLAVYGTPKGALIRLWCVAHVAGAHVMPTIVGGDREGIPVWFLSQYERLRQ